MTDSRLPRRPRAVRAAGSAVSSAIGDGFFGDVVASMRNGVIVCTLDRRIVFMNEHAHATLGIAPGYHGGRPYAEVLQACPDIVRTLDAAFELSSLPNRAELRLRSTGKVIGYTLCQVRSRDGEVSGAALLFKDLTRVEQLEERERLRDRLAALGEMAAAIAHEVKNPLAGIEVIAGLLKRRLGDDAEAQEMLGDIITEAKMANAIVIEILDFVRPIRLQVEPIHLADVLADADVAASSAGRGGTMVRLDVPPDLPSIEGDANQLRQLFTNLIANAIEALDGRGTVVVSGGTVTGTGNPFASETGGAVVVDVADDGPGIPAEIRDRIFSPFFTTKAKGSGLGLAIVRKIVEAHEGRIDVRVGERGGTTFRVLLPFRKVAEESGAADAA
jgi:two-component system nitrogen regulation sensor histidine kinase GlnL